MKFVLLSPENKMELNCQKITLNAINGKMVILPEHEPYVASVKISLVKLSGEAGDTLILTHSGIINTNNNVISLYTKLFFLVDENVNDKIKKGLNNYANCIKKADNKIFVRHYKLQKSCLIEFQNMLQHIKY